MFSELRLLVLIASVLVGACTDSEVRAKADRAELTVCQLVANPAKYNGTVVEVSGFAVATPHYAIAFGSKSCRYKVRLVTPEKLEKEPPYSRLRTILFKNFPTEFRETATRVKGSFEYRENDNPTWIIRVTSVTLLE